MLCAHRVGRNLFVILHTPGSGLKAFATSCFSVWRERMDAGSGSSPFFAHTNLLVCIFNPFVLSVCLAPWVGLYMYCLTCIAWRMCVFLPVPVQPSQTHSTRDPAVCTLKGMNAFVCVCTRILPALRNASESDMRCGFGSTLKEGRREHSTRQHTNTDAPNITSVSCEACARACSLWRVRCRFRNEGLGMHGRDGRLDRHHRCVGQGL